MNDEVVIRLFEVEGQHFMTTELQVQNVTDSHVDDTKEALISPLEFSLVEYLDGHNG